ncbi:Spermidine/putrescine transport system permease protein PotB [subsurface metagenome]
MQVSEVIGRKSRALGEKLRKSLTKQAHLPYVGPISLWIIAFVFAPLGVMLYFSLLSIGDWGAIIHTFTFKNYQYMLKGAYLGILLRTLGFAFTANMICLLIGYPIAHSIVVHGGRWKITLLFFIILPSWICFLVRIYALWSLTSYGGVINTILLNLGLIEVPLAILGTPYLVMFGLVLTYIPYMVLPIYASLEGLDPSLLEASADLGATPLKRFLTVTLPLTKGGIFAGIILVFIPCLGAWALPLLLGGGKVMLAGNLIALHFTAVGNIPMGSSIASTLTALILLVLYLCIKGGGKGMLERVT